MILDSLLTLANSTALSTAATGLQLVGDQIDLGINFRDVGAGRPVYLVVDVTTAFTSAGATDVDFIVASDAAAAIATNGTATVHSRSPAIPKATLVAGYRYVFELPQGNPAYERYLGILANVATTALTAGAISAYITFDAPDSFRTYADAVN
jgi:hypothetical protein